MSHDNVTEPHTGSKRITLNVIPKTQAAIERERARNGHNQTDILNRAAQWLDLCGQQLDAGGQIAFIDAKGKVSIVHFI